MDNDLLISELLTWAKKEQIHPPEFHCKFYGSCNTSVKNALWQGNGCKMSYVGRQYGLLGKNDEFRLVLVGIDHGERDGATFEKRRAEVEGYHQKGNERFNPHYQGLVKTAAAVFGCYGDYCQSNCKFECNKSHDLSAPCVIDRIVQPNSVKCTPKDTVGATSRATPIMKSNCAHHLASELKLLQPSLVIFHGISARQSILPTLNDLGLEIDPVQGIPPDGRGPVLYKSSVLSAHILFLYHPSRGWLERQWNTVVEPALKYLRSQRLIPAESIALSHEKSQDGKEAEARGWSQALKKKTRSDLENYDIATTYGD